MRQLAIEHFLNLDISAGDGVADDDQVGRRGQVFCVERTGEWNGKRFEQRRGRRIYARVGASDPVAALAQHARERGHGRAADANHVDVLHVCFYNLPPQKLTTPCLEPHATTVSVLRTPSAIRPQPLPAWPTGLRRLPQYEREPREEGSAWAARCDRWQRRRQLAR